MGGVKRERESFMRRFAVSIVAATVSVACGPIMGASAAPMVASSAIRGAADNLNLVERAQFIWLGRNYCWYDDGWNGPGWYWCGQYTVPGIGFGGGYGWHHWRAGVAVIPVVVIPVAVILVVVILVVVIPVAVILVVVTPAAVIPAAVIPVAVIPVEVIPVEVTAAVVTAVEVTAAGIIPTFASRRTSSRWRGSTMASNSIASATRAAITPPTWASWRRKCKTSNRARSRATAMDI